MPKPFKTLVFVVAVSCLATASFGQAAGISGHPLTTTTTQRAQAKRPNQMMILRNVLEKLNLSADQKAKVKELLKARAKDVQELRKSVQAGTVTKADAQTKRKAIRQDLLQSIRGVLTPEQAKQFRPLLKAEVQKARDAAKASGGAKAGG